MAKIPLRTYIKDVENLIERGEIEKAIAHAKNILRAYPKHIETYRLLGKAYLESQRYSDATDILGRVLSVLPDDFVSQIGMSIIREDEANLDAAIWHMERAYEVQPFNPAVQDELRRLYGRRDGIEPPKIRLTRGALIRMYARGELFPQAIAETRAALAEDSQRYDLQVLLARLYFLNGQKLEATEVCSSLIGKLPYCYEANLILSEVLPGTSRAEDARTFQQRLFALDPYAAYLSPSAVTSDQVPDQAVMVEQFLFEAELEQQDARPDWAKNVGVEWHENKEEQLPDWLNNLSPNAQAAPTAEVVDQPDTAENQPTAVNEPAPQDMDSVPDWMKSAGWTKSERSADEIAKEELQRSAVQAPIEEPDASPADIPDWLQTLAPSVDADQQVKEDERTNLLDSILPTQNKADDGLDLTDDHDLDWLSAAATGASATTEMEDLFGAKPTSAPTDQTPDWLSELSSDQEKTVPPAADGETVDWLAQMGDNAPPDSQPAPGVSDWMQPVGQEPAEENEFSASTSWMSSFEDEKAAESIDIQPDSDQLETSTAIEGELPDWLKGADTEIVIPAPQLPADEEPMAGTEPVQPQPAAQDGLAVEDTIIAEPASSVEQPEAISDQSTTPSIPDLSDMDAAMAWLESLAAKHGADEATLVTRPEDRVDTPPDWVKQEMAASATSDSPELVQVETTDASHTPVVETALPEVVDEVQAPAEIETPAVDAELPAWLQSVELDSAQDQQPVESIAAPEAWTVDLVKEPAAEPEAPAQETVVETPSSETSTPDFGNMDSALAWLESLAAKQGADEATLITRQEDRLDTPPDWIKDQLGSEEPTQPVQVARKDSPVVDAPTELTDQSVDETSATDETPTADEALPDWLQSIDNEPAQTAEIPDWLTATTIIEPGGPVEEESEPVDAITPDQLAPEPPVSEPAVEAISQTNAMPDFGDMDAAMAWLESLAAKQGADEATLVTRPEDRLDTPPDWVTQEMVNNTEAESDAGTQPEALQEARLTAEPPSETELEAFAPPEWAVNDTGQLSTDEQASSEIPGQPQIPVDEAQDAAGSWLERLDVQQNAQTGSQTGSVEEAEEETPEWLKSIVAGQASATEADVVEAEEPASDLPAQPDQPGQPAGWISADQSQREEPPAQARPWFVNSADDETPIDQNVPANLDHSPAEWLPEEAVTQPDTNQPAEEMPTWLQSATMEETEPERQPESKPSVDAWLQSLENENPSNAGTTQSEPDQALVNSWQPQPETSEVALNSNLKGKEALAAAQKAINRGQLDPALEIYNRFINDGELLDDVIHDLRDALYRYPVDISVWQALGDAFARNNQLQEAIDAYTKAEELLR